MRRLKQLLAIVPILMASMSTTANAQNCAGGT